jgi:uncharacterized NAD(P)/FAD-binding protein YdhS
MTATILIIGAGFSGAVTAVNLSRLSHGRALRIVLVNRSGAMARGIAYGTASTEHLLNVPAGNMSALADDPQDFVNYLRWATPSTTPADFVRRQLYGCYLEALLDAAAHAAPPSTTLERWIGEVVSIDGGGADTAVHVRLADGRVIDADRVVLAFGHFAPADPAAAAPLRTSVRYVRDPWVPGALARIGADEPVLLLGTGLTAVDVALSLAGAGRSAPLHALSRRGLLPAAHRARRSQLDDAEALDLVDAMAGASVRGGLRALRAGVRRHEAAGGDWRDVIAALRPATPRLWQGLAPADRARFVQRLQPYWDVARHRCAPASYERFLALRDAGLLDARAGRLRVLQEIDGGVEAVFAPRSGGDEQRLRVAHVVNCTGPSTDLERVAEPLVLQLRRDGRLLQDPLRLGVQVDAQGSLLDRDGRPSPCLHYIGPLLRARDWEATAVPELRMHARVLAERLLDGLPLPAAAPQAASTQLPIAT